MVRTGDLIGSYRVDQPLGQGATAIAFAATHEESGRSVCLKIVHESIAADPEVRSRLFREAAVTENIFHPGVARTFGVEETNDGHIFLIMELLEGESLSHLLAQEQLSPVRAIALLRQACQAVAAAHAAGVVHRDIKPANMMVSPNGHLHVVDFGIAQQAGAERLTEPDTMMGSAAYLAPELWEGADASEASDVWALGVTLYRALTGRLPFVGDDLLTVSDAIRMKTPPPPSSLNNEIDLRVDDLLASVLLKDPSRRINDAQTLDGLLSPWTPDLYVGKSTTLSEAFLLVASGERETNGSVAKKSTRYERTHVLKREASVETEAHLAEETIESLEPPVTTDAGSGQDMITVLDDKTIEMPVSELLDGDTIAIEHSGTTLARRRLLQHRRRAVLALASLGIFTVGVFSWVFSPTDAPTATVDPRVTTNSNEETTTTPREIAPEKPVSQDAEKIPPVDHDSDETQAPLPSKLRDAGTAALTRTLDAGASTPEVPLAPTKAQPVKAAPQPAEAASEADTRPVRDPGRTRPVVSSRPAKAKKPTRRGHRQKKSSREAFTSAREKLDALIRAKGIIRGDLPAVDKAHRQIRAALRKRRWAPAVQAAERGLRAVKAFKMKRRFIVKKLNRFNKHYDRVQDARTKKKLRKLSREIAKKIGRGAYKAANKLLNQGFALTQSK